MNPRIPLKVPPPRIIPTTHRLEPVDDKVLRFRGDEGRIRRWNQEGWGDHPDNQALVEGKRSYYQIADFPKGVSRDYLGATRATNYKKQYGSDRIRIEHIEQCLLLDKTPLSAGMLKDTIWALLVSTGCMDKFGPKDGTPEEKERGLQEWKEKIMKPLTESIFLPPVVRDTFKHRPICRRTGEVLWCQQSRCYYYMLDVLALKTAKRFRYEFIAAKKEFIDAEMRRLDWH